jgi:predicted glycoside hydrolase/deacetylase ChbG (UPF0249 family)
VVRPARYLIVNADDFGASRGVNEGVAEAHRRGIVTSASLMVGTAGSEHAVRLAREHPALSIGLHVSFDGTEGPPDVDLADPVPYRASLEAQLARFTELVGRPPTHLDSHHHVHAHPDLVAHFREVAERYGIPLREYSGVRYCARFYGQWAGESHPEGVSTAGLIRTLAAEVAEGVTELACHPGHPGPDLASSYRAEREWELQTLCDPRVRRFLVEHEIALVGQADVPRILRTVMPRLS